MSTAVHPLAVQLNKMLAEQPKTSPLDLTNRCDRCGAAATSRLEYEEGFLQMCAKHTRDNLPGLLESTFTGAWFEPRSLWAFTGVNTPGKEPYTGDGLSDS